MIPESNNENISTNQSNANKANNNSNNLPTCPACEKYKEEISLKNKEIEILKKNLLELKQSLFEKSNLISSYIQLQSENENLKKLNDSLRLQKTDNTYKYQFDILKQKLLNKNQQFNELKLSYDQLNLILQQYHINKNETNNILNLNSASRDINKLKREISEKDKVINSQNLLIDKLKNNYSECPEYKGNDYEENNSNNMNLNNNMNLDNASYGLGGENNSISGVNNINNNINNINNLNNIKTGCGNDDNKIKINELFKEKEFLENKYHKYKDKYFKFKVKYKELKSNTKFLIKHSLICRKENNENELNINENLDKDGLNKIKKDENIKAKTEEVDNGNNNLLNNKRNRENRRSDFYKQSFDIFGNSRFNEDSFFENRLMVDEDELRFDNNYNVSKKNSFNKKNDIVITNVNDKNKDVQKENEKVDIVEKNEEHKNEEKENKSKSKRKNEKESSKKKKVKEEIKEKKETKTKRLTKIKEINEEDKDKEDEKEENIQNLDDNTKKINKEKKLSSKEKDKDKAKVEKDKTQSKDDNKKTKLSKKKEDSNKKEKTIDTKEVIETKEIPKEKKEAQPDITQPPSENPKKIVHINPIKNEEVHDKSTQSIKSDIIDLLKPNGTTIASEPIIKIFKNLHTLSEKINLFLSVIIENVEQLDLSRTITFVKIFIDSYRNDNKNALSIINSNILETLKIQMNLITSNNKLFQVIDSENEYYNIDDIKNNNQSIFLVSFLLDILYQENENLSEISVFLFNLLMNNTNKAISDIQFSNMLKFITISYFKDKEQINKDGTNSNLKYFINDKEYMNYSNERNSNSFYFLITYKSKIISENIFSLILNIFQVFVKNQNDEDKEKNALAIDTLLIDSFNNLFNKIDKEIIMNIDKKEKINLNKNIIHLEIYQLLLICFNLKDCTWVFKNIFNILWNQFINSDKKSLKRALSIYYTSSLFYISVKKDNTNNISEDMTKCFSWLYSIYNLQNDPEGQISFYDQICALSWVVDSTIINNYENPKNNAKDVIKKLFDEYSKECFPRDFVSILNKNKLI